MPANARIMNCARIATAGRRCNMGYATINAASVSQGLKAIRENTEVADFTVNGKCSGCGACCANILPMTRKEIAEIKRYVKRFGIKPQKHFVPSRNPVYDMICPFRANNRCVIYPVRPYICRIWDCGKVTRGEELDLTPIIGATPICVRETFFGG